MNNKMIQKAKITAVLSSVFIMMGCNNPESGKTDVVQSHSETQHTEHAHDHNRAQPVSKNADPAENIPEFKFYKLKSGFGFEKSYIPSGKNTIFILFDPSCRHCQVEAGELAKNYNKLKDINLLFISMNDPALMDKFLPSFGEALEGKENVEMLYDRDQQFVRQFHVPSQFPANYVYGPDGKLKSYWSGEKDIQEILAAFTK